MYLLAIESSCDETAVAILGPAPRLLASVVASQVPVHQKFGGVVPEIASRQHLLTLNPLLEQALQQAQLNWEHLGAVAVTRGPGLVGSLLVGISAAKAIAWALNIPLIGVNHLAGHIYANFLAHPGLELPALCLVVSGGHTDLIYLPEHGRFERLGRTRDDAAGEAFDKVARALGLGYPGGPLVDRLAREGNPEAISLPRAFLEEGSLDFSFSGLKSAVLNYLNRARQRGEEVNKADLAAAFQEAVIDVLVEKTLQAAGRTGVERILLAGGVAANSRLRQQLEERTQQAGLKLYYPPLDLCTDNAAMIGAAGWYLWQAGYRDDLYLNAEANLPLV
ncbi:MAG: tRNA (adenosine(37)-N6)-threonylcarbamoyltransferase complex transferase subunit TsaD [Bacillota bacterium]